MKNKTLKLLLDMSKYACIGFVLQFCIFTLVFAIEGSSQKAISVKELALELEFKNEKIENVFSAIESASDFEFIYYAKDLKGKERFSLKKQKIAVSDLLLELSRHYDFGFRQINRNITVKGLTKSGVNKNRLDVVLLADVTISGRVTDENGEGLPGASIIEEGTANGTTTDLNGKYQLTVAENSAIVVSFVGYQDQHLEIAGQSEINVSMVPDAKQLDEIVVIGYGTSNKKDLVSSVSKVSAKEIQNQPTPRLDQALQGRATGVEVTSNNGAPGSGATIRIRGTSSINGNNNPLFVIDGFIAGTNFNLNSLNVNDVESIEILKDATALSIYGTRGAAGVILITTKSGKNTTGGEPNVSVNQYVSIQSIANNFQTLGGQDYIDYKNEESQFIPGPDGFGMVDPSIPVAFPGSVSDYPNTDWLSLVEQNGLVYNTDLSVAGNGNNLNYFISVNRFDQKGVITGSGLERYSLRANLDLNISDKVSAGVRFNIEDIQTEKNKVDWLNATQRLLSIRPVYQDDGTFSAINPQSGNPERNPVADISLRQDKRGTRETIVNSYLQYEPIKNLILKSTVGVSLKSFKDSQYLPGALPERAESQLGGSARIRQEQDQSVLNENTISYIKDFGDHTVSALAGVTWQKDVFENTQMSAGGFVNDAVGFNAISIGSNQTTYDLSSDFVQRTYASILSRINYSYKGKYNLTLAGRRDGSSVFEEGNKYSFFPSVGMAWNIDEENFMNSFEPITALKFRSSYGIVGEQGVRPYNSLATFQGTNTYFNQNLFNAIIIGRLPSSNLSWETTKQLDFGLELELFKGRISLEADYYIKKTQDLLLDKKVPGTVGDTQLQNIGEIENKGVNFSINTINISKGDLFWETSLNISSNKNKVLNLGEQEFIDLLGGLAGGSSMRLLVGETVPSFYGIKYLGTYKNQEEIIEDNRQGKSYIGGPRFEDFNGDGEFTEEDRLATGNPQPDFYGGFRNVLSYKGLTLDAFVQFSFGNEILNESRQTFIFGKEDFNLSREVLGRWQEGVNENSNIPRAGAGQGAFFPPNSLWVEDASLVRLKSITLSYDLPVDAIKVFKSANIYFTANNLLLITDFSLGDPEVNFYDGSSDLRQGVYRGQYPYTRSFTTGIRLNF